MDASLEMREKIGELERQAMAIEPNAAARRDLRSAVVEYSEEFLSRIRETPAYNRQAGTGERLLDSPIEEQGLPVSEILELLRENVDTPGLNPASGGHLGYIPGGGIYSSALGDYLADIFNRYAGVFYASPGAVRMENMLIRWLNELVGYPRSAAGNIASGGSIANLIAIVTARDAMRVRAADVEQSVIYLSAQTHHSVDKAIRIAGLRECIVRHVPLDGAYRIDADRLGDTVAADRASGLKPFLIVASAGSTDVGAVDPLEKVAAISREFGLWLHVDAAYGGFFLLTDEGKTKMRGIELSDSVVIDPHKGLFLPYGAGVVLIRNRELLQASHYYTANYMQDAASAADEPSPAELSPELTKHFRGLRMWLPLKLHGVAPFRACLQEKLLLARYFHSEILKLGFESRIEPELSVVVYRYVPDGRDANDFNRRLLEAVVSDGRVFISSTLLDGDFVLRFACLAFRTHLDTVDTLLAVLKEKRDELLAAPTAATAGEGN